MKLNRKLKLNEKEAMVGRPKIESKSKWQTKIEDEVILTSNSIAVKRNCKQQHFDNF